MNVNKVLWEAMEGLAEIGHSKLFRVFRAKAILNVGIRFTRGPRAFRNYVLFDVFSIVQDGGWYSDQANLSSSPTSSKRITKVVKLR